MANGFGINPLIAMQARAPDVGGSLNNALMNINAIEQMRANRAAADQAEQLAPLKQQLLEGQVSQQEIEMENALIDAEFKAMADRADRAEIVFNRGGKEALKQFMADEIAAGATVDGGRGMVDSQDFQSFINNPRTTDEQILAELDFVRDAAVLRGVRQESPIAIEQREIAREERAFKRAKELKRMGLEAQIKKAGKKPTFAEKEAIKKYAKRFESLSETAASRESNIKEAQRFLQMFKDGDMQSGATRAALGFVPGVFTEQAELDEQFNSLAEQAARMKLKAAGETRPTDADVEGMKRAMFGVGRDEQTNIRLLQEFINEQLQAEQEFQGLVDAANSPEGFAGFRPGSARTGDQNLTIDDLLKKYGN